MLPRAPSCPRPASAPPRQVGDGGAGPGLRGYRNNEEGQRKAYIKKHRLHIVLGETMTRCLDDMPSDPSTYLARLLLQSGPESDEKRAVLSRIVKLSELEDEAQALRAALLAQRQEMDSATRSKKADIEPESEVEPVSREWSDVAIDLRRVSKTTDTDDLTSAPSLPLFPVQGPFSGTTDITSTNTAFGGDEKLSNLIGHGLVNANALLTRVHPSWEAPMRDLAAFTNRFYEALEQRCARTAETLVGVDVPAAQSQMLTTLHCLVNGDESVSEVRESWSQLAMTFGGKVSWDMFVFAADAFVSCVAEVNRTCKSGGVDVDLDVSVLWLRLFAVMCKCISQDVHSQSDQAVTTANLARELSVSPEDLSRLAHYLETVDLDRLHCSLQALFEDAIDHSGWIIHVEQLSPRQAKLASEPTFACHLASLCTVTLCGIRDCSVLTDAVRLSPWTGLLALRGEECRFMGACLSARLTTVPVDLWDTVWEGVARLLCDPRGTGKYVAAARGLLVSEHDLRAVLEAWVGLVGQHGRDSVLEVFASVPPCPRGGVHEALFGAFDAGMRFAGDFATLQAVSREIAADSAGFGMTPPECAAYGGALLRAVRQTFGGHLFAEGAERGWAAVWRHLAGLGGAPPSPASNASVRGSFAVEPDAEKEGRPPPQATAADAPKRLSFDGLLPDVCKKRSVLGVSWAERPAAFDGKLSSDQKSEITASWDRLSDRKRRFTERLLRHLHLPVPWEWFALLLDVLTTAFNNADLELRIDSEIADHELLPCAPPTASLRAVLEACLTELSVPAVQTGAGGQAATVACAKVASHWFELFSALKWSPGAAVHFPVKSFVMKLALQEHVTLVSGAVVAALGASDDSESERAQNVRYMENVLADAGTTPRALNCAIGVFETTIDQLAATISECAEKLLPAHRAWAFDTAVASFQDLMLHGFMMPRLSTAENIFDRDSLAESDATIFVETREMSCLEQLTSIEVAWLTASWRRLKANDALLASIWVSLEIARKEFKGASFMQRKEKVLSAQMTSFMATLRPATTISLIDAQLLVLDIVNAKICSENVPVIADVFLSVVQRLDPGFTPDVRCAWSTLIYKLVLPSIRPLLPPTRKVRKILINVWESFVTPDFVAALTKTWESTMASSSRHISQTCLLLKSLVYCGPRTFLLMRLAASPVAASKDTYAAFSDMFVETLNGRALLTDDDVSAVKKLFMSLLVSATCKHALQSSTPLTKAFHTSAIPLAAVSWARLGKAKLLFLENVLREWPHDTWGHLPKHACVQRLNWFVETMFDSPHLRASLMNCAGERWQREGMTDTAMQKLPSAFCSVLTQFVKQVPAEVVQAWTSELTWGVQAINSSIAVMTNYDAPPTVRDIELISLCQISDYSRSIFFETIAVIDPTCPRLFAQRTLEILPEAIEECFDAPNEFLSTLRRADTVRTSQIWCLAQALAASVGSHDKTRTLEKEIAWRRFFEFRIAPQLLWEEDERLAGNPGPAALMSYTMMSSYSDTLQRAYKLFAVSDVDEELFWSSFKQQNAVAAAVDAKSDDKEQVLRLLDTVSALFSEWTTHSDWLTPFALAACNNYTDIGDVNAVCSAAGGALVAVLRQFDSKFADKCIHVVVEVMEHVGKAVQELVSGFQEADVQHEYQLSQGIRRSPVTVVNHSAVKVVHIMTVKAVWAALEKKFLLEKVGTELRNVSPVARHAFTDDVLSRFLFRFLDEFIATVGTDSILNLQTSLSSICREHSSAAILGTHYKYLVKSIMTVVTRELPGLQESTPLPPVQHCQAAWLSLLSSCAKTMVKASSSLAFHTLRDHLKNLVAKVNRGGQFDPGVWNAVTDTLQAHRQHLITVFGIRQQDVAVFLAALNTFTQFLATKYSPSDPDTRLLEEIVTGFQKATEPLSEDQLVYIADVLVDIHPSLDPLFQVWSHLVLVAQAAQRCRGYITIHNRQYDFSAWRKVHPGGSAILDEYAGRDATDEFDRVHGANPVVSSFLRLFRVEDGEPLDTQTIC
ncbi:hypothetical protein DIPPA_06087 [Diplonema papillatum]|nr:hypothetical protein DIPPA_06087 [Diplonema papillatum]